MPSCTRAGSQLPRERLLRREGKEELRRFGPRLSVEQRRLIRTHLGLISTLNAMLRGLRKEIRRVAAESIPAVVLQTVPGIGPYWGLLLSTELTPVERFRTADHLVSYAGLAPITRASGGHVRHGPLPKMANRWVRGALVAALMSQRPARAAQPSLAVLRAHPSATGLEKGARRRSQKTRPDDLQHASFTTSVA